MATNRRVQGTVLLMAWNHSPLNPLYRMVIFGDVLKLQPRQKALIKSSSRGGWKVGYQHHCRSSVRPARLHLLNTSSPSPSQSWPRLPKTTPWRNELIPYSSYSTLNIYFISVIFSTSSPELSPLSCLHYWWGAGTEVCCALNTSCQCLQVNGTSL